MLEKEQHQRENPIHVCRKPKQKFRIRIIFLYSYICYRINKYVSIRVLRKMKAVKRVNSALPMKLV